MQERIQTRDDQQLVTCSPDTIAETIHISETDTSAVKTMTVPQTARSGINTDETTTRSKEGVLQVVVDPQGYRYQCIL